jgi:cyclopropane-fatty-acyl-phospholipid synthase
MTGLSLALAIAEKGWVPDWLARTGIRRLIRQRLKEEELRGVAASKEGLTDVIDELRSSPIAIHPEKANEQHYEVPPEFFLRVLGKHLKYSGCLWLDGVSSLDQAEAAMLKLTCERAELEDGQQILELGCGWGSLTLWMAEHYPSARILAMSNSGPQREFIMARAAERGLQNLEVITSDVNDFETALRFDRVVSVEMFEHVRNYEQLLFKISNWLKEDGRLFVHIFCHRCYTYPFETEGAHNWMGRHFFTGGLMPSKELLNHFNRDLVIEEQWQVDGSHYSKTARAWLKNLDNRRQQIDPILAQTYGSDQLTKWRVRWRLFFMACEELFGFRNGQEWLVAHYRFKKADRASTSVS